MNDPFKLKNQEITNSAVIEAFEKTSRKLFIPKQLQKFAEVDGPLPIGKGQTISQPSLVAFMTQLLDVGKHHAVLEIGTGSGFQTAILSRLAKEIVSVEIIPTLLKGAKRLLSKLGYKNISYYLADDLNYQSLKFDRIMVTAASKEIPKKLIGQLNTPGKMVVPVGEEHQIQTLMLIEKDEGGKIKEHSSIPVRFVPLKSVE